MTQRLFRQQYRPTPSLDANYWSFMLGGLVEIPLLLSYQDLTSLPMTTVECTLACIGNPPGGPSVGQARWDGMALSTLLDEMRLLPEARYAHLHAADGYATSIHLAHLQRALLAYRLDDAPLPSDYGGPVRLIVPGLYGYKMPKWIQRIVLAAEPLPGLWEKRGWSPDGEVQVTSAILSPNHRQILSGEIELRGIAYAGEHAITQVEISIEDGPWMPAPFVQSTPYGWAEWSIFWTPPAPGDYRIQVRAADSAGRIQSETENGPFPDGAAGLHAIVVKA